MSLKIIILFVKMSFLSSLIFGQSPKIKKQTVIRYKNAYDVGISLNFRDLIPVDTMVNEYDINGNIINNSKTQNSKESNFNCLVRTIILDSTKFLIHKKEIYNDTNHSSDIFEFNNRDCVIILSKHRNEVIYKTVELYKGNNLITRTTTGGSGMYSNYFKLESVEKVNYHLERTTEILKEFEWMPYKIKRYDYNHYNNSLKVFLFDTIEKKWIMINKVKYMSQRIGGYIKRDFDYSYNQFKKEWFISRKEVVRSKRKAIILDCFYHDYFKLYFKKKTIYESNKFGNTVKITIYDMYLKKIKEQKVYSYEYY